MRTALRLAAGALFSAFLPCIAIAAEDNYQGLWWNEAESGWGLSIAHQGGAITATWLTYDALGRGSWLTLDANRLGDGTYAGTVYQSSGPVFEESFDAARIARLPVGQATLAFGDTGTGTLRYSVHGMEGAKAITREIFGPLPTCTYAADPQLVNAGNYTDLWWAAEGSERGWTVHFAHQGDVIVATWSTFGYSGEPLWLVSAATKVGANAYAGTLYRTTGPAFGTVPFDPAKVTRTAAGTASFTFSNGNAATFTYTMGNVKRTKAISRELFLPPAGTRCRDVTGDLITGRVFDTTGTAATVCADANRNGRCDGDEAQARADASGAYALRADAAYTGPLVAETIGGYRMASPGRDYSADITPYTTLVQLTGERDFGIAEMMVRNELGLPQRFAIRLDAPPADGSLAQSIAGHVVVALKASAVGLAEPDALTRVVAAFPPALTELPQIRITTKDGAPVVSKEIYVDATYEITNPAAAHATVTLAGKIRGRGNYTWEQVKKPYKVQLANDAAYAALGDVLGMAKNRNWALLADYLDPAVMRNQLVFTLGNSNLFSEGLKWSPALVRVELWLNGRFDGLYALTEDVRVDPVRLNISKMGANDLEGGYLVEVDVPLDCYNDGAVSLQHETPQDVHICVKTPDETAATQAQLRWIKGYIDQAEYDLYALNSVDRLNLVSYADWYLVNEFIKNWDGPFFSSDYMWKDCSSVAMPGDRLLNMGPLWDFDISAGNTHVLSASPEGCWIDRTREGLPNWYTRLRENPQFVDLVVARWNDKQAALRRLTDASIATFQRRLQAAQRRNLERWMPFAGIPLDEAAGDLKRFLDHRHDWMNQAFDSAARFALMCK